MQKGNTKTASLNAMGIAEEKTCGPSPYTEAKRNRHLRIQGGNHGWKQRQSSERHPPTRSLAVASTPRLCLEVQATAAVVASASAAALAGSLGTLLEGGPAGRQTRKRTRARL